MYSDLTSPWPHYEANYLHIVEPLPRSIPILEIGPGHGSMIAWLRHHGFTSVEGVDSSPGDVEFANRHLGPDIVAEADALSFLEQRVERYEVVVMKAVLEHIPRDEVLSLLEAIHRSLRPDGILAVEVPNMDWLLASHERYMDLTHATGYTRESLSVLLGLTFEDVDVRGSRLAGATRSQRLFRRPVLALLRRLLYVMGEGASDVLFAHRSLVATARRR